MVRAVLHRYTDPLDEIWLGTALAMGLTVVRTQDAYASTDGNCRLLIGESHTLDADDCLAQMIFHELCHALVQGPGAFALPDWGLCNQSDRDVVREHACLRAQAHLAHQVGLRRFLAPTTEHRAYFDPLPDEPLAADEPAAELARVAVARARKAPFAPHLDAALVASAKLLRAARPFCLDDSLLSTIAEPDPV